MLHATQISLLDQFDYTVHHYAGMLIVVLAEHNVPLKEPQRNEQEENICTGDL